KKPATGSAGDGFGFYLKPVNEPVDTAGNPVSGYARGLGVEFNTFGDPGYHVRVNNTILPGSHRVSPAVDELWHRIVIDYRAAPGQAGTLTVTLDGATILNNIPVNYTPTSTDVFAFAARTGGSAETASLDNIEITAFESPVVENPVNQAPSFTKGPDQT